MEKKDALLKLCGEFIADKEIRSAETIYQADRVAEGALDFIEEICNVVGYLPAPGDAD